MDGWNYNPSDAKRCWAAGDYEAVIADCDYGQSKSGNDMATVKIDVFDGDRKMRVTDWIVNHPNMLWKTKALAKAVGMEERFAAGNFMPHEAVGKNCVASLIEEDDAKYGEQNRVSGYKPSESATPPKASAGGRKAPAPVSYDDIPEDSEVPF